MLAGRSPAGLRVWQQKVDDREEDYHVFPEWNADAFLVQDCAVRAAGDGWHLDQKEHEPFTFATEYPEGHPERMDQGLVEWYFQGPKPDEAAGHDLLRRAFADLVTRDPSLVGYDATPCGFTMFLGDVSARRGLPRRRKARHRRRLVERRRKWAVDWGLDLDEDATSVTYTPPEVAAAAERVQRVVPFWVKVRAHCYRDETALRAAARFVFEVRCADTRRLVFSREDAVGCGRHRLEMCPASCWVDCTPRSMGGGFIGQMMRFFCNDMPPRVLVSLRRVDEDAAVLEAGWETNTQKIHMTDEGDNVCYRVGHKYPEFDYGSD